MNIHASIVDQRLEGAIEGLREQARAELGIRDPHRLKSLAFVHLCVQSVLELDHDAAFDCLTEGGGDFGVDAFHIAETQDSTFTVTLFQGKYKRSLEGTSNFPETGIHELITAIGCLFDPSVPLGRINPRLQAKVEEARSLIRDGFLPYVHAIACNNGKVWNASAQERIDNTAYTQIKWEHVNHDWLVNMWQTSIKVGGSIQLAGPIIVENRHFVRVLVGRITADEVATLLREHGTRLLERNIRRYLGLKGNRVNQEMRQTLLDQEQRKDFYMYNNGITMICSQFNYSEYQGKDHKVLVRDLQIINGGQTCTTILRTAESLMNDSSLAPADVLLRLYELPPDREDLVHRITYATNSQNPVDLRDLRSNDDKQKTLAQSIAGFGWDYRRHRSERGTGAKEITSGAAAIAVLSVWRKLPHKAKFYSRDHFGKLYDLIFSPELNGAEVIVAVRLFRIAEARRRKPKENDAQHIRYSSCFCAMLMGKQLLTRMSEQSISHLNFEVAQALIDQEGEAMFVESAAAIEEALTALYGREPDQLSLQQLAATFRRGDLISFLEM